MPASAICWMVSNVGITSMPLLWQSLMIFANSLGSFAFPTKTKTPGIVSSTNEMPNLRSTSSAMNPVYGVSAYGSGLSMYFRASTISAATIVASPEATALSNVYSSLILPLTSPRIRGNCASFVTLSPVHAVMHAYYLPCITAWTGERVTKLAQLPRILGEVRGKIREEYTFDNAVASGEATMVAAEIVEALKYIDNPDPYADTPYTGFIADEVLRRLGISFVDDTIPGVLVLVGKAKDPKLLAKIIRDCQSKGMLVIPTFDTIQQIAEAGIEIGERKGLDRLLFCVGEFTQAIHGLSFAIRAALTFGNIRPGDRAGPVSYTHLTLPTILRV